LPDPLHTDYAPEQQQFRANYTYFTLDLGLSEAEAFRVANAIFNLVIDSRQRELLPGTVKFHA